MSLTTVCFHFPHLILCAIVAIYFTSTYAIMPQWIEIMFALNSYFLNGLRIEKKYLLFTHIEFVVNPIQCTSHFRSLIWVFFFYLPFISSLYSPLFYLVEHRKNIIIDTLMFLCADSIFPFLHLFLFIGFSPVC